VRWSPKDALSPSNPARSVFEGGSGARDAADLCEVPRSRRVTVWTDPAGLEKDWHAMALELQIAVCELVHSIYGGVVEPSPPWLNRPGPVECGRRWRLVCRLYYELTGLELPDEMPPRDRRTVDLVLRRRGEHPRIIEVDESQHFNLFRARTLRAYPRSVSVAFDRRAWLQACDAKTRLEGGGFGRPRPPLFPDDAGRHRQRAFRDALADVLPDVHDWQPTLRLADFETQDWVFARGASKRMRELLARRL
jgi:hypothetical protein